MPPAMLDKSTQVKATVATLITLLVGVGSGTWTLAVHIERLTAKLSQSYTFPEAEAAWREAERGNAGFVAPDLHRLRERYGWQSEASRSQTPHPTQPSVPSVISVGTLIP